MTNDDETMRPTDGTTGPTDATTQPTSYPAGPATENDGTVPLKAVPAGRGPARFGTIFWGVLLLVFAVAMGVSALPMVEVDPTTLLLAGCIAAGVLLVAAGLVATFTRPRR